MNLLDKLENISAMLSSTVDALRLLDDGYFTESVSWGRELESYYDIVTTHSQYGALLNLVLNQLDAIINDADEAIKQAYGKGGSK